MLDRVGEKSLFDIDNDIKLRLLTPEFQTIYTYRSNFRGVKLGVRVLAKVWVRIWLKVWVRGIKIRTRTPNYNIRIA